MIFIIKYFSKKVDQLYSQKIQYKFQNRLNKENILTLRKLYITTFLVINLLCFINYLFQEPLLPLVTKYKIFVPESIFPQGDNFVRFRRKVPHASSEWKIDLRYNLTSTPLYNFIDNNTNRPSFSSINNYMYNTAIGFGSKLSVFTNIFVTYQCALLRNNNLYYSSPICQSDSEFIPKRLVGVYADVLSLCHSPMKNYARFTFDVFCFLLYIPQKILENSTFITNQMRNYIHESLNLFNIQSYHVLKPDEYVYALRTYSIEPHPCVEIFGQSLVALRAFIKKIYNLDEENPYIFAFFNRKETRHISNLKQIYYAAKQKYPGFFYMYDQPFYTTYLENSRLFNKILILFTPHGALCVNLMFMQPKTVLIEIQADISGYNFFKMGLFFDIYHIFGRIPDLNHFGRGSKPFPIEKALLMIDAAVDFVRTHFYNETREKFKMENKLTFIERKN